MAGYPPGSGYPYGAPPPAQPHGYGSAQPYGAPQPYGAQQPYGAPQPYGAQQPYGAPSAPYAAAGEKPPKNKPEKAQGGHGYGSEYGASPFAAPSAPYTAAGEKPPKNKPEKAQGGYGYGSEYGASPFGAPAPGAAYGASPLAAPAPGAAYGASPFAALVPSAFPPGTDPNVVACFQAADADGSGFIDDKELQGALSSYNQSFSIRTVHLLMLHFTNSNVRKIGPKEFISLFYSLQNWRANFERFDRDRSGKIDASELQEALLSLGLAVSPLVLDLLVSKFEKSSGKNKGTGFDMPGAKVKGIEYDNFIECCLTVKGLTEKFKEKDTMLSGSATFTYESFMLTVLPFLIA